MIVTDIFARPTTFLPTAQPLFVPCKCKMPCVAGPNPATLLGRLAAAEASEALPSHSQCQRTELISTRYFIFFLLVIPFAHFAGTKILHSMGKCRLGFNPRSQANSEALSDFIGADLQESCPALRSAFARGELRPRKNPAAQRTVAERSIQT